MTISSFHTNALLTVFGVGQDKVWRIGEGTSTVLRQVRVSRDGTVETLLAELSEKPGPSKLVVTRSSPNGAFCLQAKELALQSDVMGQYLVVSGFEKVVFPPHCNDSEWIPNEQITFEPFHWTHVQKLSELRKVSKKSGAKVLNWIVRDRLLQNEVDYRNILILDDEGHPERSRLLIDGRLIPVEYDHNFKGWRLGGYFGNFPDLMDIAVLLMT